MITLITGENAFEVYQAVHALMDEFVGEVMQVDGSELELRGLPDLLMGTSLFSTKRLIIIRDLSASKTLWANFVEWLPRVSDDVHLVLVEPKPDKRTLTYKELKKDAKVVDYPAWGEQDNAKAERWVEDEALRQGISMDKKSIQLIVRRVGTDQWQLFHALEKLAVLEEINVTVIEQVIDAQPSENVFTLFEMALRGEGTKVIEIVRTLQLSEEPYRLFALLSGQAFQLAVIFSASPADSITKDFGISPFVVSKLANVARHQTKASIRKIIMAFAKADDDMKVSKADPWLLIEKALLTVASLT